MGVGQHVFPINHESNALRYTLQAIADQTMMMTERGHLSSPYRICLTNTEFAKLCSMSAVVAIHRRLFSTWNLVDIQGSLEVDYFV